MLSLTRMDKDSELEELLLSDNGEAKVLKRLDTTEDQEETWEMLEENVLMLLEVEMLTINI